MAASSVDDPARQASFVFLGTVVRLNAATEPTFPVTSSTAVVRVEDVLQAPVAVGEQTDREITVQLRETEPAQEGQKAVFFTSPWLYGVGLAVVELDRREARESASIRKEIRPNSEREKDEALQQRLATAEVVVVGTATNSRPLVQSQSPIVTEHDPEWWEATIAVWAVEKGTLLDKTVTVVFAASMDVMWFQAPKIRVGQEGIWLLHRESIPKLHIQALAVLDPLDALPKDQLERVRRLLGGGPAPPAASAPRPRRRK